MYNLDAVAYESLMVGLFSVLREPPDYPARDKINSVGVGFSRDGFHWERPTRDPILNVSDDLSDWNASNVQSVGGGFLVVGDELHFYASGRKMDGGALVCSTGLAILRRDGFASMNAGQEEGVLSTRPVLFKGKHLFVNLDAPQGVLRAEVLDADGNVIAPFTRENCVPLSGDGTLMCVQWKDAPDLSALSGTPVRFRFFLKSGALYSFWVSPDRSGASHGYVAAGGPGFTGPTDNVGSASKKTSAINIGTRLELIVDEHLIERMSGAARLRLHSPTMREVAIVADKPWEGNAGIYWTFFQDGDLYRAYYGGQHYDPNTKRFVQRSQPFLCYAQSRDGIHWTKPELGLVEFKGSKKNNIVLGHRSLGNIQVKSFSPDHISVFKDTNPNCPPQSRYKALARAGSPTSLVAFHSRDGIHFSPFSTKPVITKGAFDSLNLAFWDCTRGEYRVYLREFIHGVGGGSHGWRGIKTATSKDFKHWTDPVWLDFPGAPLEHLYTNQIQPYFRAPHLFLGFPMRYHDPGWSEQSKALPGRVQRERRAAQNKRFGSGLTDGLFMSSRDGITFKRWGEAIIRPGLRPKDNWVYGDNCVAWGILETKSSVDGAPHELSIYATESNWSGKSCRMRRYTYRTDGFVSVNASLSGGEFTASPSRVSP